MENTETVMSQLRRNLGKLAAEPSIFAASQEMRAHGIDQLTPSVIVLQQGIRQKLEDDLKDDTATPPAPQP